MSVKFKKRLFYGCLIIILVLIGVLRFNHLIKREELAHKTNSQSQNISLVYLKMVTKNEGWAIGSDKVYRTIDGGATWEDVTPQGAKEIYTWYFLNSDLAWIVSSRDLKGTLYRTENGGRHWVEEEVPFNLGLLFFTPSEKSYNGWALKNYGPASGSSPVDVYKLINGSWSMIHKGQGPGTTLEKPGTLPYAGYKNGFVFLPDTKTGFVTIEYRELGKYGLYVTRDGGYTWLQSILPIPSEYSDSSIYITAPIFFNDEKESTGILPVWFMNKEGDYSVVFFITHDKGQSWSGAPPFRTKERIISINITDRSHWWVLTESKLYGTRDGGNTWNELHHPKGAVQIQFVTPKVGWALINLDTGTEILHSNNGGVSWKRIF
ncbi:hypothetical protein LZ11_02484 [Thermosediminibacter litoriperuensis]|uniref:Photosynthesis system II assembly factor YCF48-like protein n=1 Tax=Thermosediminibacter litoriperuensis TaxID=291989 RepID=A0A5S5AC34_9FIRM|nr:hypothetical protein LZ11_02484 [Thermosediminibacter litoriperuensis]